MWILGVVGFILMMLTFWSLPYLSIYSKELFCRNHEQQHVSLHWICTIVLVILAWWVIQARFVMSGEDAPLLQSTYAFNESKLRGLHSNKVSVDWVSDVMGKYRGYKDKGASVLFYGYASNIFTYLSDDGKIKNVDFSFRENARNIKAFRIGMETHPEVVFLCAYNPGARVLYTLDSYPQIHSYLMDHGYMCDNNKYYAIYYLK